jgi:hypothetical protein
LEHTRGDLAENRDVLLYVSKEAENSHFENVKDAAEKLAS